MSMCNVFGAMLSLEKIAEIKANIKNLENARENCEHEEMRDVIQGWIEHERKKLTKGIGAMVMAATVCWMFKPVLLS
jgi:hypothetical protein